MRPMRTALQVWELEGRHNGTMMKIKNYSIMTGGSFLSDGRNIISIHTNLVNVFFQTFPSIFSLPPQEKCRQAPGCKKYEKNGKFLLTSEADRCTITKLSQSVRSPKSPHCQLLR